MSLLDALRESASNLASSEVPSQNEIAGLLGALIHHTEHGEVPAPVDQRVKRDGNGEGETE